MAAAHQLGAPSRRGAGRARDLNPVLPPRPPAPEISAEIDSQGVFAALFVAYPDALLLVDAAGHIALANPEAARLFGYSVEELSGLSVDVLVPDGVRPRHAACREAYSHQPRPRPMGTQTELVAKRRDGSEVTVEIALSPLQSHGVPLVVAAIRDIGEYPRVKQALRRARYGEHLAQVGRLAVDSRGSHELLEQVPGIAAAALDAELVEVLLLEPNGRELRIAGGVGLLDGARVGNLIASSPDTAPGFVLAYGHPVTIDDYRGESRFTVPAAFFDAGIRSGLVVPLSDRGRNIGVIAVQSHQPRVFGADDVRFLESLSNLLATSLQRAESEEALKHAQRLESVGQLTGGIAHDFNNLLTVILGNLQVLEELPTLAQDAYARQLVAAAARAGRRSAELTGKLLAFSRRQVLQPAAVDVKALLDSLADMLRRTLDQRIRIEVDAAPGCPPCLADPGQLESALLNIAINARDAMIDGGTLNFRCAPCIALPDSVRDELAGSAEPGAVFVALSISDTGTGMAEDVRDRAFEPFFTTKGAGRGTGLGLSTVYGFVKQSTGAVTVDSVLGRGTTVTLYLPSHPHAVAAASPADREGTVPADLRVLLVEDDSEVRAVVQTFLDALGCVATACTSGEQARSILDVGAGFDVLVTDIALGTGMRGTSLAAYAQERLPALGVLLMSGYSAELFDADRESPPKWQLLHKPFSRDELARGVAKAIV